MRASENDVHLYWHHLREWVMIVDIHFFHVYKTAIAQWLVHDACTLWSFIVWVWLQHQTLNVVFFSPKWLKGSYILAVWSRQLLQKCSTMSHMVSAQRLAIAQHHVVIASQCIARVSSVGCALGKCSWSNEFPLHCTGVALRQTMTQYLFPNLTGLPNGNRLPVHCVNTNTYTIWHSENGPQLRWLLALPTASVNRP